jgi:hypothetical protein
LEIVTDDVDTLVGLYDSSPDRRGTRQQRVVSTDTARRPPVRAKGNGLPASGQARPNIKRGLDDRAIASVARRSRGIATSGVHLPVGVPRIARPGDLPGRDLQRVVEAGGAVALVVELAMLRPACALVS